MEIGYREREEGIKKGESMCARETGRHREIEIKSQKGTEREGKKESEPRI